MHESLFLEQNCQKKKKRERDALPNIEIKDESTRQEIGDAI